MTTVLRRIGSGALLLSGLALSGCGWFESEIPGSVTLIITGDEGALVDVLVSTKFVAAETELGQTRIELIQADTITVPIPWSREFNIAGDYRFFTQVSNPGLLDPVVNLEAVVAGDTKYDEGGILRDFPLRFLYMFNQRTAPVIEVL
jgi:hypothetical protein